MAATQIQKAELESELKRRLNFDERDVFDLERIGTKLSGNVVSDRFSGLDDLERQNLVWNALEEAFGKECALCVGTLLAFTHDEWNVQLEGN